MLQNSLQAASAWLHGNALGCPQLEDVRQQLDVMTPFFQDVCSVQDNGGIAVAFSMSIDKILHSLMSAMKSWRAATQSGEFMGCRSHPSQYVTQISMCQRQLVGITDLWEQVKRSASQVQQHHTANPTNSGFSVGPGGLMGMHPDAVRMWIAHFGLNAREVSTPVFLAMLNQEFGPFSSEACLSLLRSRLDANSSGVVNVYDFALFSLDEGPRVACIRCFESGWVPINVQLFDPRRVREIRFPDGRYLYGEIEGGRLHGYGMSTYPDGRRYVGGYRQGLRHGVGVFEKFDPGTGQVLERYEGKWSAGKREGIGRLVVPDPGRERDGNVFIEKDCEWVDDRICGQGRFTLANGSLYVGDVISSPKVRNGFCMHGNGRFVWPDGRVYIGNWHEGRPSGSGSMQWPNGRSYTGAWHMGQLHGFGRMQFPGGRVHNGEFRENRAHGTMTSIWPDGVEFVCHYENGRRNGSGEYRLAGAAAMGGKISGEFYEEAEEEGERERERRGRCRITLPDGSNYEGPYTRHVVLRTFKLADGRVLVPPVSSSSSSSPSLSPSGHSHSVLQSSSSSPTIPIATTHSTATSSSSGSTSVSRSLIQPVDSISGEKLMSMRASIPQELPTMAEREYEPNSGSGVRGPGSGAGTFIHSWLMNNNLSEYLPNFLHAGISDPTALAQITEEDIRSRIGVEKPGHVKKLLREADRLRVATLRD